MTTPLNTNLNRLKINEASKSLNIVLIQKRDELNKVIAAIEADLDAANESLTVARKAGDLRENADYQAMQETVQALEYQKYMESRKQGVFATFSLEDYQTDGFIGIGTTVRIDSESSGLLTIKIVPPEFEDAENCLISIDSEVGRASLGKKVNDIFIVTVRGGLLQYKIKEVY